MGDLSYTVAVFMKLGTQGTSWLGGNEDESHCGYTGFEIPVGH
jgi:hypothetical protein